MTPSMQVFDAACDRLAGLMTPHGFKYRKSKRDLRRLGRLFEHIITFGTSRSINSIPGSVHLEVRAIAWSTRLAEYRKKAGISLPVNEAVLFGTTIENIFHPAPPYVRYDVGDPETREEVLRGIETVLQGDVLRAYDLAESPPSLRAAVNAGSVPCLSKDDVRDYFGCF